MSKKVKNQATIDKKNKKFWDEPCGATSAKKMGLNADDLNAVKKFDSLYLNRLYPYLKKYIKPKEMSGKKVLEVGLGYGTLGGIISENGANYYGLDIASGPVKMMNSRLKEKGLKQNAVQGSILECPFDNGTFDYVVSLGCFHHTGDIQKCFSESYRILKKDGVGIFMVYNQFSLKCWTEDFGNTLKVFFAEYGFIKFENRLNNFMRSRYDNNTQGESAPETVLTSRKQLREMLKQFKSVEIYNENLDYHISIFNLFRIRIPRRYLLTTLGRLLGRDLYIICKK